MEIQMMKAVENKVVNEIVLIRGLPGSGKSTRAKKMQGYLHLEADMFLHVDGVYVYDQSKVRVAHEQCLSLAKDALEKGMNVVISNTFVKIWELQLYVNLGYPFRIMEMKNRWSNVHAVPEDKIEIMARGWQKLPRELQTH